MLVFIWDDKNVEHIAEHGVSPDEAEFVLHNAHSPYPMARPDGKFLVWGPTNAGRLLQVIFVERKEEQVEIDALDPAAMAGLVGDDAVFVYVIHAMELSGKMKRQHKKRRR